MHDDPGHSWHDMGGAEAGAVLPEDHDYALWEKRVDALMMIAFAKGLFNVDQMRKSLEEMGPAAFERMSYYERWVAALNHNLTAAGVYTTAELGAKMEAVARRGRTYGDASGGTDG